MTALHYYGPTLSAVQWTGDNTDEIVAFCNGRRGILVGFGYDAMLVREASVDGAWLALKIADANDPIAGVHTVKMHVDEWFITDEKGIVCQLHYNPYADTCTEIAS